MIANPDQAERLLARLQARPQAALPLPARLTPELAATLQTNNRAQLFAPEPPRQAMSQPSAASLKCSAKTRERLCDVAIEMEPEDGCLIVSDIDDVLPSPS